MTRVHGLTNQHHRCSCGGKLKLLQNTLSQRTKKKSEWL